MVGKKRSGLILYGIIGGILFAFNGVLGKELYASNSTAALWESEGHIVRTIIRLLWNTVLGGSVCVLLWWFIDFFKGKVLKNSKPWKFLESRFVFWGCWGITFLAWVPCYLSYYPGILSYDSNVQTLMARRIWPWTTHHPPIHTFLWKVCLSAGYRCGVEPIVIYSLLQMVVLSGCLALVTRYLIYRKCNNFIVVIAFVFYAFNPVIAIFSFTMTKDVYFAAFLILFSISLLELVRDTKLFLRKPVYCVSFILLAVISCLFRNNFIYAYILLIPVLGILLRKRGKRVLIVVLAPVVLTLLCTKVLYPLANIEKGDTKESLSVPMQQIALVAETEELPDYILEEIHEYIPDTSAYNPRFADPVKYIFSEEEFNENKMDFFRLWCKLLVKYPMRYLDAFLALNIPFWYMQTDWIDPYAQREYIETYIYDGSYTFERNSVFPGLNELYEGIASGEVLEELPVVSGVFSINTPVWILLFTALYLLAKKDNKKLCVPVMFLLLWLTYLAGPVSCLRYIFPIMLAYPVCLWLLIQST